MTPPSGIPGSAITAVPPSPAPSPPGARAPAKVSAPGPARPCCRGAPAGQIIPCGAKGRAAAPKPLPLRPPVHCEDWQSAISARLLVEAARPGPGPVWGGGLGRRAGTVPPPPSAMSGKSSSVSPVEPQSDPPAEGGGRCSEPKPSLPCPICRGRPRQRGPIWRPGTWCASCVRVALPGWLPKPRAAFPPR